VMTIAHMAFEPGEFINKLLTYILHITNWVNAISHLKLFMFTLNEYNFYIKVN
jgi:hypothetical protein